MVDKCANPHCEATFQYSSRGQLFPFELRSPEAPCKDVPRAICDKHPTHATICFWLCEECCRNYTLSYSTDRGLQLEERNIPEQVRETHATHSDYLPSATDSYDGDVLPGIPM